MTDNSNNTTGQSLAQALVQGDADVQFFAQNTVPPINFPFRGDSGRPVTVPPINFPSVFPPSPPLPEPVNEITEFNPFSVFGTQIDGSQTMNPGGDLQGAALELLRGLANDVISTGVRGVVLGQTLVTGQPTLIPDSVVAGGAFKTPTGQALGIFVIAPVDEVIGPPTIFLSVPELNLVFTVNTGSGVIATGPGTTRSVGDLLFFANLQGGFSLSDVALDEDIDVVNGVGVAGVASQTAGRALGLFPKVVNLLRATSLVVAAPAELAVPTPGDAMGAAALTNILLSMGQELLKANFTPFAGASVKASVTSRFDRETGSLISASLNFQGRSIVVPVENGSLSISPSTAVDLAGQFFGEESAFASELILNPSELISLVNDGEISAQEFADGLDTGRFFGLSDENQAAVRDILIEQEFDPFQAVAQILIDTQYFQEFSLGSGEFGFNPSGPNLGNRNNFSFSPNFANLPEIFERVNLLNPGASENQINAILRLYAALFIKHTRIAWIDE